MSICLSNNSKILKKEMVELFITKKSSCQLAIAVWGSKLSVEGVSCGSVMETN